MAARRRFRSVDCAGRCQTDLAQKHNLYTTEVSKVKELTMLLETIRAKGQVR